MGVPSLPFRLIRAIGRRARPGTTANVQTSPKIKRARICKDERNKLPFPSKNQRKGLEFLSI